MTPLPAAPGDVLAVWAGSTLASDLIRAGAALQGKPAIADHVVIITHRDQLGRWIGIQGQPGGVGMVDCTGWLADSRTRTNHAQPRDPAGLPVFLASAARSIGIAYDWAGIAEDTALVLHAPGLAAVIDHLWRWPSGDGRLPGHVVCSSLAAMLYDLPAVNWAHPSGADRKCDPADWWDWNNRELWLTAR